MSQLVALTIHFLLLAVGAKKLAVYDDVGVGPSGDAAFAVLKKTGIDATKVSHAAILNGSLAGYDAIFFPGGSGNQESISLTRDGQAIVKEFVANGGGYLGICAGGYMAIQHLEIINATTREPFDRGNDTLVVEFNKAGQSAIGYYGNVSIYYHWGPVVNPDGGFTTLASYRTETHSRHPEKTTGQQVNTPALFTANFGRGRVLVSGPHPELTAPVLDNMLHNYAEFVMRERDSESIIVA